MSSGPEERSLWKSVQGKFQAQDPLRVHPEAVGSAPEEPRQWCSFEYADCLEQGLGPGLTSRFMEVCPDVAKEFRLLIHRTDKRSNVNLLTEGGQQLLVAKSRDEGARFDIYVTAEGSEKTLALGPAFVLQGNKEKNRWSLSRERCDLCESLGRRTCGSHEIARMSHYVETVGEGQAFCLDLEMPVGQNGSRVVTCGVCGDPKARFEMRVSTRRPKWNPKHKSLTLDFRGRCSLASAKNFQLEDPGDPQKCRFLFGKVGAQNFVLDFRNPLSHIQAFATALSAMHWK